MVRKIQLVVIGAVASLARAQLCCSDSSEWKPQVYAGGAMTDMVSVWYDGNKYKQQYYAAETDVPGAANGPWLLEGPCTAGTMGGSNDNGSPGGPTVDCSDATQWEGARVYDKTGEKVIFHNGLWSSKWWSQSTPPEGGDGPWEFLGNCDPSTVPAETEKPVNPELDAMLCSCCEECVSAGVTGPECKELVSGECFFTDCRKVNTFDPEVCQDVISANKYMYYSGTINSGSTSWPTRVYAPYVDAGLPPLPRLPEIAKEVGVKYFNLAFVQSAQTTNSLNGCHGAIAGMAIEQGPIQWDEVNQKNMYMWDDVNALRELGGDIIVSFGGAAGIELADREECYDGDIVTNLVNAYSHVIDYLKLTHIDFDIEGAAAAKNNRETGWKHRFEAVKQLKQKYPYLKVWWTLPVLPAGLVDDGVLFITDLVEAGAPMDILNVMNMDYGDDVVCPGNLMGPCERQAMENVARQLFDIVSAAGKLGEYGWTTVDDVYPRLGSTPMLGMNDVTTEIYYLSDAKESLNEWKTKKPLGLVSNWSLARDEKCEASIGYVDLHCSGAPDQSAKFDFARVFQQYTQ